MNIIAVVDRKAKAKRYWEKNKNMKIAVVSIHSPEANGVAMSRWNFANILSLLGHKVFFITRADFNEGNHFSSNSRIQIIPVLPAISPRSLFWSAGKRFLPDFFSDISPTDIDLKKFANSVAIKLRELIKNKAIDIVFFAESFMEYIDFLPTFDSKVIIGIQCPRYLFQKIGLSKEPINKYFYNLERKLIPTANVLISPSKAMAELASEYYTMPLEQIIIIPNPVDNKLFYPIEKKKRSKETKICFVGRFSVEKGANIIIKIIPELMKKHKNLFFSIIGQSGLSPKGIPLIDELKTAIEAISAIQRFSWKSFLAHTELSDFYCENEIFLFPTLFESFGNVIAEAQACGLPVIANAVGGVPELIIDGETGFLIKDNDENQYIEKLEKLITDSDLREKMGKRAVKHAQESFSFQIVSEKFKAILSSI